MAPGIQGGISLDPDQFYFGGHLETSPLVDRLRFRPSVDIGIGDDLTLVAATSISPTRFREAARGISTLVADRPSIFMTLTGGSDTEGGFNFIVGAKNRDGLFFEMKVGLADSPDLKFGVGYTFR